MLEILNLSCSYDGFRNIAHDINFSLKGGEIISITGPNGSGKSTLLRAICGIIPFCHGEIFVDGISTSKMKKIEISQKIALLSQLGTSFDYADFSVFDTVMLGRFSHRKSFGIYAKEDKEITERALKITDTFDLRDLSITKLSGGQLKRVMLARTFAQDPKIILLDEPSNHLDLKHQLSLLEILKNWVNEERSVISVFHDLNLAANISDRILLMNNGEIILDCPPKEFCSSEILSKTYGFNIREHILASNKIWK